MPVRDVDIVVLEQNFDGVAEQGGEVAGHRGAEQHFWLRAVRVLFEVDEAGEGGGMDDFVVHRDHGVADGDFADAVGGAGVRGAGIAENLHGGVEVAQGEAVGFARGDGLHQAAGGAGHEAQRVHDVGLRLIHFVDHYSVLNARRSGFMPVFDMVTIRHCIGRFPRPRVNMDGNPQK